MVAASFDNVNDPPTTVSPAACVTVNLSVLILTLPPVPGFKLMFLLAALLDTVTSKLLEMVREPADVPV